MNIKDLTVDRFDALCRLKGIKRNELATRAGVTPSSVYSMFNPKRRNISLLMVKKLCDGLDISVAEFFNTKEFAELEQEIK